MEYMYIFQEIKELRVPFEIIFRTPMPGIVSRNLAPFSLMALKS